MTEMTRTLLDVVEQAKVRGDVVGVYAAAILGQFLRRPPDVTVEWGDVNRAIIDRWSLSGLQHIKARAWKSAEKIARVPS